MSAEKNQISIDSEKISHTQPGRSYGVPEKIALFTVSTSHQKLDDSRQRRANVRPKDMNDEISSNSHVGLTTCVYLNLFNTSGN
jgi:hypothetical protein